MIIILSWTNHVTKRVSQKLYQLSKIKHFLNAHVRKLFFHATFNNLSWTNHVTKRVSQKLYQLSKIKHFLNAHVRKLFFHAHIQPIIDYASTLWKSASANTLKPLVSIHKQALKLTLLKSTSLTAQDYKLLDVLPLKLKLEFNKGLLCIE